jgi:hypothetical protein
MQGNLLSSGTHSRGQGNSPLVGGHQLKAAPAPTHIGAPAVLRFSSRTAPRMTDAGVYALRVCMSGSIRSGHQIDARGHGAMGGLADPSRLFRTTVYRLSLIMPDK